MSGQSSIINETEHTEDTFSRLEAPLHIKYELLNTFGHKPHQGLMMTLNSSEKDCRKTQRSRFNQIHPSLYKKDSVIDSYSMISDDDSITVLKM